MPSALAIINAVCRRYVLHAYLHNFVPNIFKWLTLEVGVEMHNFYILLTVHHVMILGK